MIVVDVEQGSPEWLQARLGVPSGSGFSMLITSQGKKSTQMGGYVDTLVAETLMGAPLESFNTPWMDRGNELEAEARAWYEFQTDQDIGQAGFVLREDGLVGVSPDGLTDTSGLEVKCPKAKNHIGYLRGQKVPAAYVAQVQGCMWICERDTWDFVSYHPLLPKLLITVPRDNKFITTLAGYVDEALTKKQEILETIRGMGV